MLDKPDTDVVREWLAKALDASAPGGTSRADLARHCKVSPQAVNGWLRTGRISKSNLEHASAFFGHGPSFTRPGTPARQQAPVFGAAAATPEIERLSTREIDLILAWRAISQRDRDRFYADLMKAHEEATQFAAEVLARSGSRHVVSDARAAAALPERPDGEQRDSVPGTLT